MRKVNFKRMPVRGIEGEVTEMDLSKQIGNRIYAETADLGELDLAQRIYKDGEVELSDEETETVRGFLKRYFKAFVQKAFEDVVNENV